MSDLNHLSNSVHQLGFARIEAAIPSSVVEKLLAAIAAIEHNAKPPAGSRSTYALRNLIHTVPAVQTLARSPAIRNLVIPVLGPTCFAVRGIFFDKIPEANWKVAWHQDLTIAVKEQKIAPGFGPWSEKAGVTHVQPPIELLEQMLTVRLHLDDCGTENGPLQVIPGSHLAGKLDPEQIILWRNSHELAECLITRGGAVVIRPLLLHASSSATIPGHRRVIHLEFAACELPYGLDWHERW